MGQTGLDKVVAVVSVALQWPELVTPLQGMPLSELRCPVATRTIQRQVPELPPNKANTSC